MARNIFPIKPLAKTLDASYPSLNQDPLASAWPTLNVQVDSKRIRRRWDYVSDRTLEAGSTCQYVTLYRRGTGVVNTLFLTTTGLYKKATVGVDDLTPGSPYTMPSNERWQFAVVNDIFCFTNGDVNVQKWDGAAATAADLDGTNAVKARYCTCFANRLVLADMYLSGVRQPWTIKYSKEGDPTNWTDSTGGEVDFADTDEPITGLGRVGNSLVVFKKNAYYIGTRTGVATSPITFPTRKSGIGLWSPYSLVEAMGTCFWMGHDNFYGMNGEEWEPIGDAIKYEFFSKVSDDERAKVWGVPNPRHNEILWFATTSEGQRVFSYKYREGNWTVYTFPSTVTGFMK